MTIIFLTQKLLVDYFAYALTRVGIRDIIREDNTKVETFDFPNNRTSSNVVIGIDGADTLVVYGDRVEFDSLRLESSKISTVDSNADLVLEDLGTGSVQVNDNLFITETPDKMMLLQIAPPNRRYKTLQQTLKLREIQACIL